MSISSFEQFKAEISSSSKIFTRPVLQKVYSLFTEGDKAKESFSALLKFHLEITMKFGTQYISEHLLQYAG